MSDQPNSLNPKDWLAVARGSGELSSVAPACPQASGKRAKDKEKDGRFALRMSDYALMADLKVALRRQGRVVKKSQLLRAGLRVLACLPEAAVLSALDELKSRGSTTCATGRRTRKRRPEGTA